MPGKADKAQGADCSYRLRPAAASDAGFLSDLHRAGSGRYLVTSSRDEELWRYEVAEREPASDEALEVYVIEIIPEPPLYRLDRQDHYSFYVRVPDLPRFLQYIAPVLERRSTAMDYRLGLEHGRLSNVEGWNPTVEETGDAAFPDLTFLQLLFGHRSLDELDYAFADCRPGGGAALFPKRPSDLWPVC